MFHDGVNLTVVTIFITYLLINCLLFVQWTMYVTTISLVSVFSKLGNCAFSIERRALASRRHYLAEAVWSLIASSLASSSWNMYYLTTFLKHLRLVGGGGELIWRGVVLPINSLHDQQSNCRASCLELLQLLFSYVNLRRKDVSNWIKAGQNTLIRGVVTAIINWKLKLIIDSDSKNSPFSWSQQMLQWV